MVADATLPRGPSRFLEIGSGWCAAMRELQKIRPRAEIIGCDLATIGFGARPPGAAAVCGDALAAPFGARTMDAVLFFEVVEHVPDVEAAVEEVLRVLRRPGLMIAGVPNHSSLWVPVQDLIAGRQRRAFGVDGPLGALRWLLQNAAIMARKRAGDDRPLYREPILESAGGDADAVYYACPLDLVRLMRRRGARLITTHNRLRWRLGRFVPTEVLGSSVLAFELP